jgi:type III pantothenate kinase
MKLLCIDWGNTLVKAAVMDGPESFLAQDTFTADEAMGRLSALIDAQQPRASILCSVVNHEEGIEGMLAERTHFVKLTSKTQLPIMNAYFSSDTLGMDRLAAVAGAYAAHPDKNNLVVVLGTCVTYNFITKNGAFRGGAISPGFQMRLDAMHQFTDGLPQVPQEGPTLLLGYDTATCMRSGVVFGIAAEIDGMVEDFKQEYGEFNAVLTGGDAPLFARHIKSGIFADPQITLKGLYQILKHNVRFLR